MKLLVADIGGTNARFAYQIKNNGDLTNFAYLKCSDFENIYDGRDRGAVYTRDGQFSHHIGAPWDNNTPNVKDQLEHHITWYKKEDVFAKGLLAKLIAECYKSTMNERLEVVNKIIVLLEAPFVLDILVSISLVFLVFFFLLKNLYILYLCLLS